MERRVNISRIILYLFLFLSITTSIIPMVLAYDLITLDSYDTFIALLDKFYIPMSYFTKVIINNLDYTQFNIFKMLSSLITSLSYMNVIMIMLVSYLWAAKKENAMRKKNKCWQTIVGSYVIGYFVIAIVIIFNFQLTSLNAVIYLFRIAGIIMVMTHTLIIIVSIVCLIKELKSLT